ncbi:MAG: glutamate 5-kinase [Burkholderiaceae bacterium]|nr:glutamate 5-kinase [Burkholderiaceae bacterium]
MSEPAGHDSTSQLPPGREIVPPRPLLVQARRIVVKVGSTLVTNSGRGLDSAAILRLAEQIATLRAQGKKVVLVSSGAVAEGMLRLGWKKRPSEMHSLQAAAAVGQMGLANVYEECFRRHGMKTAQILLTHDDLANRQRYLNARSTLLTLLKLGVVPIINENDTVVTDEIKFGDNDTLAALVTNLIEAEVLVILTDQEGLYTADPRKDPAAVMLASVHSGDPELERMAGDAGSIFGRGGMATKVLAAKRAATSGAHTIIASGRQQDALTRMAAGEAIGTQFITRTARLTARKQWLSGHLQARGSLKLDAGAARALAQGGKSLLAIGVTEVRGDFERGELVACLGADGQEIARGLVNYASAETRRIMGKPSSKIGEILGYVEEPELMHRDNLVLR